MAFTTSSDSIIIRATLTEKGKKLLARGRFKIAKFALGDDEVDYRLYNSDVATDESGYKPALKNTKIIEALKDTNKNIEFGLDSYDSGILYLTEEELDELDGRQPHAFIEFLPILVKNTKTTYAPTIRDNKYYVSVNDETTKLLNDSISSFNFLETNDYDKIKIVVESGIEVPSLPGLDRLNPTLEERDENLVKKFLLDEDLMISADNRLIQNIIGIQKTSKFENYASGHTIINFNTNLVEAPAISLNNTFDYHATFLLKTIPNLIAMYETADSSDPNKHSNLNGPKGTISAFNIVVNDELKVNSTGIRDARFSEFGHLNSAIFNEMPTRKFDYIDTTIYIVGATSNSSLQIPLRIIRYAGL